MGQPKQLLPLGGRPIVWHVVNAVTQAAVQESIMVTGAYHDEVTAAVTGMPVKSVYNPAWKDGQSASVKAGFLSVQAGTKAVLFIPADQPFITTDVINDIIQLYHSGCATIVAPVCKGRRGTPVLFDSNRWTNHILSLSGDEGARRLFTQFPQDVAYLPVGDERLLWDADTPEEYAVIQKAWLVKEGGA
jgi:molybdenum cofactor cytidylyltransferase